MRTAVILIPNWNGARLLAEFLPLAVAQGARVVVVDNGSTDDSARVARSCGAEVIALGVNRGFAAAVNAGVRGTTEALVAIVNNDARLAPDWLATLAAAIEQTGASLATGKILSERQPDLLDGTYDLLSRGATAWRAGAGARDAAFPHERRAVHFVSLTAAVVRREAFERAGPLDEDFESYLEDVEFSLRCARLGLRGVYEPAAIVWHRGSATLGAWHTETTRRIARNQLMLAAKHFPERTWAMTVGQLQWGAVALRHGAGAAWLRGRREGLQGYGAWHAASAWHKRTDDLAAILRESETDIQRLQALTGWQSYWRWYFRLAGRADAK